MQTDGGYSDPKCTSKSRRGRESAREASTPMWDLPEPHMPMRMDGVIDAVSTLGTAGVAVACWPFETFKFFRLFLAQTFTRHRWE